jgi:hypothetical protein
MPKPPGWNSPRIARSSPFFIGHKFYHIHDFFPPFPLLIALARQLENAFMFGLFPGRGR